MAITCPPQQWVLPPLPSSQLPLHPYALRTPLEPFTTMLLAFARRGFAIVHAPRLAGALLAVTKARAPLSTLRPAALRFSSIAPEKMVEKFGLAGMSDEKSISRRRSASIHTGRKRGRDAPRKYYV